MNKKKAKSLDECISYEVQGLYPDGREHTGAFSCENNHKTCKTKCPLGVYMDYNIVGA